MKNSYKQNPKNKAEIKKEESDRFSINCKMTGVHVRNEIFC